MPAVATLSSSTKTLSKVLRLEIVLPEKKALSESDEEAKLGRAEMSILARKLTRDVIELQDSCSRLHTLASIEL